MSAQGAEKVRARIMETLVDVLDWEETYPNLGLTRQEAARDYVYLTDRLMAALVDG